MAEAFKTVADFYTECGTHHIVVMHGNYNVPIDVIYTRTFTNGEVLTEQKTFTSYNKALKYFNECISLGPY